MFKRFKTKKAAQLVADEIGGIVGRRINNAHEVVCYVVKLGMDEQGNPIYLKEGDA